MECWNNGSDSVSGFAIFNFRQENSNTLESRISCTYTNFQLYILIKYIPRAYIIACNVRKVLHFTKSVAICDVNLLKNLSVKLNFSCS